MSKMRTRIGSILMALALAITLLPAAAMAEGPTDMTAAEFLAMAEYGTITLEEDVNLTDNLAIDEETALTVDLNGHQITASRTSDGIERLISIFNGASLTITDGSDDKDGTIILTRETDGSNARVETSLVYNLGTFRLEAGTLQVTAAVTTKLVGIVNYGTASVQGGTIRVEKESAAGEVYGVQNTSAQGSFSISGDSAIIVENESSESAYGIYSSSTEAMVAQTAEITAANTQGPAVGVYGPATISGGKVTVTGGVADKTYALRGVFGNKTTVTDGEFTVLSPTDAAVATQCVISGGSFSGNVSDWAADGYTAQKGENGRYTLVKLDANNAVAQVGDNYYNSLSAAVAAAPADSTVMLLQSTTAPQISISRGITIDLMGCEWTGTETNIFSMGVNVPDNCKVTIRNGKLTGTGNRIGTVLAGNVTIESCTVTGVGSLYCNGGTVLLKDTDLTVTAPNACGLQVIDGTATIDKDSSIDACVVNGCGVFIQGNTSDDKPVLKVYGKIDSYGSAVEGNGLDPSSPEVHICSGAELTSQTLALYLPQAGTVNITGATITGEAAIGMKSGTLNIVDSTIRGTGESSDLDDSSSTSNGIVYDGSAIVIDSNVGYAGAMNITISGNSQITSDHSTAIREIGNTAAQTNVVSLNISGGTFSSPEGTDAVKVRGVTEKTVSISGGTFSSVVPPEYCAPGLKPVTENGVNTVGLNTDIFSEGTGTADNPYLISSVEQLEAFRNDVNTGNDYDGKYIKLKELAEGYPISGTDTDWDPIGSGSRSGTSYSGNVFKGNFNGNSQTISGLTITSGSGDTAIGLFGVVAGGTVENVKLKEVSISAANNKLAGGVAGMLCDGGVIRGCEVASGSISAKDGAGGIVGRMVISGTIENCINRASVTTSGGGAGGIVGKAYYTQTDKSMKITDCQNYGKIEASGGGYIGGIAGLSAADVSGCTNHDTGTVTLTGSGTGVGGIVGEQQSVGSVTGCENAAAITGSGGYGTGGIVGWVRYNETTTNYPNKEIIEVTNNTNSGTISGGNDGGGIVGALYNAGVVTGNENRAESISGVTFAAGIVGNMQYTENPGVPSLMHDVTVYNNVSTSSAEKISAKNSNQFAYNNNPTEGTNNIGENSTDWVAKIGQQQYATVQAAISSAADGETVTVLKDVELTDSLNVSGKQNLTIQGVNKDVTISAAGVTDLAVFSGTPDGTFTLKNLTFEQAVITIRGASGAVKVDNCTFQNTMSSQGSKLGVLNLTDSKTGSSLLVTGSTFQDLSLAEGAGSAEIVGIYTSGTLDSIKVEDSQFKNIAGTALSLRGTGTMKIIDNVFENWASGSKESAGRALRVDFSGQETPALTFTGNKLLPGDKATESFVKIGEISGTATPTLHVEENYWDGKDPTTGTVGTTGTPVLEIVINGETLSSEELKTKEAIQGEEAYYLDPSMDPEDLSTYEPEAEKPDTPSSDSSSDDGDYSIRPSGTSSHGSVIINPGWADKGDTVTLTVKPNDGYELGKLTVLNKSGDEIRVTAKGDNKYTFTMPAGNVTVEASFVRSGAQDTLPFVDVAADAYYYDAVKWAIENDVTQGVTVTAFQPNSSCTRAQTVTFLWRAAGSPAPETTVNPFTDVSASDYYYEAVLWAVENGITQGTTATTFGPGIICTRAQVVTFLYRYSGEEAETASSFSDVAADAYYAGAVNWAVENGVTQGVTATAFQPNSSCTRAQIVTFLYRYMAA